MIGRRLIVTADDFGADEAVNEAVEIGHRQGVLSAASLMVTGPAVDDAVGRAKSMPDLRVGLHLVLVEGRPSLPAKAAPALVDAEGAFRNDMAAAGARMFFDPAARRQLAAEIDAQFAAFAATGLMLDHINAHKHFHLHPTICGLMLKAAARYGLRAARIPVEPAGVLARCEPEARLRGTPLFDRWAALARRRVVAAGMTAPNQVFGLRWSGAMSSDRLAGLIEHLPDGLSEIYLHPATKDVFPGSTPGYRYREELEALISPQVIATVRRTAVQRGGFQDFAPAKALS